MWFLFIITIINAAANNKSFLDYRIGIGAFPVNGLDILLALGLIFVVVLPRFGRMPVPAMHPAYKWVVWLFVGGAACGFIGCAMSGADARDVTTAARNYLALPASIIIGYGLLHNMRSAKQYPYVHVLAGIISALMVLMFFSGQGENSAAAGNVNLLRTIDYITSYAGTAAAFLLLTIMSKFKWIPKNAAIGIAAFCILGQFATLSRSEWIATGLTVVVSFLFLPRGGRKVAAIKAAFVTGIMAVVLFLGVQIASSMLGWDFASKIEDKLYSLLPGVSVDTKGKEEGKAWDSRLPGAAREVEIFTEHPVIGAGFAATAYDEKISGNAVSFNHNAWTATLCATGLLGFFACVLTVGSCIVVGKRMIADRFDVTTVVMGALGATTGVYYIIYGASTMSFNVLRPAIPLGVVCGVLLRTRAMQLALMQSQHETVEIEFVSEQPTGFEAMPPGLPSPSHW